MGHSSDYGEKGHKWLEFHQQTCHFPEVPSLQSSPAIPYSPQGYALPPIWITISYYFFSFIWVEHPLTELCTLLCVFVIAFSICHGLVCNAHIHNGVDENRSRMV